MLGHEDEGHTVGTIVQKVKRLQGSLVGSHYLLMDFLSHER